MMVSLGDSFSRLGGVAGMTLLEAAAEDISVAQGLALRRNERKLGVRPPGCGPGRADQRSGGRLAPVLVSVFERRTESRRAAAGNPRAWTRNPAM